MTPFEKIEFFKSKCISAFGERLECLIITGSYARGDYTPQSDIDLWVFVKNLSIEDIKTVGKIVSEIGKPPDINPNCASFAELKSFPLRDQFDPAQLYIESRVIYGSLTEPAPTPAEVEKYALSVAAFGLMLARHYIAAGETEESLAKNKYVKWSYQPLIWAYRCKAYLKSSVYPRDLNDLLNALTSADEKEIVNIYSQIINNEFKGSYIQALEKVESASREFIKNEK
jgi:predicted nucleotidyltransferase